MEIQDSQFSILTLFLTMYITLYIYVSSTVLGEDTVFVTGADPGKILTTAQMVKVKMGVAQGADPPERP